SIPLMYVGSRFALSARRSCVNPEAPRNLRTFFPKDVSDRARLDIVQIRVSIDDKSMDDESSRETGALHDSQLGSERIRHQLQGARVLILTGKFKGEEGVCLGKGSVAGSWAVSPDSTAEILSLAFETDFALLVDLSSDPT